MDPIEDLIRRLLLIQRAGTAMTRSVVERITRLFARVERDIRRADPGSVASRYRNARRERLMREIEQAARQFTPEMEKLLREQLVSFGAQQAQVARTTLIASIGDPSALTRTEITPTRLRAILTAKPFEGRVLKAHAERLGANTVDRIQVQINLGLANEEPVVDIVRRVRGKKLGDGFSGGVYQTTTRDAEALVRTAATFASNEGMMATFQENATVVDRVRFVAALDDRTTALCLSLDGTSWPLGSEDVRTPPLHYNCRSVLVPQIDWAALGMTEPPEGVRSVRDLSGVSEEDLNRKVSARRSDGKLGKATNVPSSVLGEEWLRSQPVRVQDKMFGRARAELFREGKVSLKDLVTRDGRLIPLDELLS